MELLGWIVQSGGKVAGSLIGFSDGQLVKYLERLKTLGLVFRYETSGQIVYSAHPFLRDFFRNLLGTKPASVHESVRAKLAPSLEARPSTKPSDPAILDQYEMLIEQTLLAGHVQEAFDLYYYGLGGGNLGWVLGENGRGLRILERFVPQDDFSLVELPLPDRSILVNELGLFALALGDLARAREALAHARRLNAGASNRTHESAGAQNLADVEMYAGRFGQSLDYAESAFSLATEAKDDPDIMNSLCARAIAHFFLGEIPASEADFQRATELERRPLYSSPGAWEAECKLLRGDRSGALSQTQANREIAARDNWNDTLCRCNASSPGSFLQKIPLKPPGTSWTPAPSPTVP